MIRLEFFKALDELCPKNPEDAANDKKLIHNWFDRAGLKPDDLDTLIIGIQENHPYKTFPRLPVVIEIWDKINQKDKPKKHDEMSRLRERTRDMQRSWYDKYSTQEIIKIIKATRDDGIKNSSETDRMFIAEFDPLYEEHNNMRDQGMPDSEIFERLRIIKDCLRYGKPYQSNMKQNFDLIPETEDREGRLKKYSGIEEKIIDKRAEAF